MRKILTLIVALVATATVAHAQFGIVGGLNFSSADKNAKAVVEGVKSATLWHAGVAWKLDLPLGFAIQPELTYQVKGVKIDEVGSATVNDFKFNNGYIELGAGVQWGPDLIIARPYVFAQPFIGYLVNPNSQISAVKDVTNKLEYGIGLGGGVELFKHFQLSVQWFKNMGNLVNGNVSSTDQLVDEVKDLKSYQGVRVSLGIFF